MAMGRLGLGLKQTVMDNLEPEFDYLIDGTRAWSSTDTRVSSASGKALGVHLGTLAKPGLRIGRQPDFPVVPQV